MNEPQVTIIGNLTAEPELRYIGNGTPVASFTIASTPRNRNQQTNQWEDGEPMFVRCTVWREYAENVTETLTKGTRVIAYGKLTMESFTRKDGTQGTSLNMQVDEIAPSLRYVTATIRKNDQQSTYNASNRGVNTPQSSEQTFDTTRVPQTGFNASTGNTANRGTYNAPAGGSPNDPWTQTPTNDTPPF